MVQNLVVGDLVYFVKRDREVGYAILTKGMAEGINGGRDGIIREAASSTATPLSRGYLLPKVKPMIPLILDIQKEL